MGYKALGFLYYYGRGLPKDAAKEQQCTRMAAKNSLVVNED